MSRLSNKEEFVEKARKVHGDRYDYSKVDYVNNHTKVCIICREHGEFWQRPSKHLSGQGCPKCSGTFHSNTDEFVEKSKKIHGDRYDYSKVEYVNNRVKVRLLCREHGEFTVTPHNHLKGRGCPICANETRRLKKIKSTEGFIDDAKLVHGDKYNYSKTLYTKAREEVTIICPKHGEFRQRADAHLYGNGCPICQYYVSEPEDEIYGLISKYLEVKRNDRRLLGGNEIDLLIPGLKIGIEYDGILWHSEEYGKGKEYHLSKTERCRENGYSLIHIFSDEWLKKKERVKNYLLDLVSLNDIDLDKCEYRGITKEEARKYFETYTVKNYISVENNIGCLYEGEIIGVLSYIEKLPNFCNISVFHMRCNGYDIQKVIVKNLLNLIPYKEKEIELDRRWLTIETEQSLLCNGFEVSEIKQPIRYTILGNKHIWDCGSVVYRT